MGRASSRTAGGVALLRAAHQLLDEGPKLLEDPIAAALLSPQALEGLRAQPEAFQSPGSRALRSHLLLRSRYAEDRLAEAVTTGVGQYLVLGAGLDTFAYRQPAWAKGLHIFEVDHPASQAEKRDRLEAAGIPLPSNLTFASVDFEHEHLATALLRSGFDPSRPTFISWLGVTMYLTLEAIDAVFAWAAELPPGSGLVLTFAPAGMTEGESFLAEKAAQLGEPWLTHFEPQALVDRLRRFGFSEVALLSPEEAVDRYFRDRTNYLPPPRRTSIAFARR